MLVIAVSLCSCKKENSAIGYHEIQIPDPGNVITIDPVKLIHAAKIIIPELTKESGISEIEKIHTGPQGQWVVMNHNPRNNVTDLLLFSHDGFFKNRIKGLYDGPGNFTGLEDFLISQDTLELFDGVQNKRVLYNTKGQFIKENSFYPDISQVHKISNNLYAVYRGNAFQHAHNYQESDNLVMVDAKGKVLDKAGVKINPAFADNDIVSKAFWKSTRGETYFLPPVGQEIYVYHPKPGDWSEKYTFITKNKSKRKAELERIANLPPQNKTFDILNFLNENDRWISNYRNFAVTENFIVVNYPQSGESVFACYNIQNAEVKSFTFSPNIFGNFYLFFPDPNHILFAIVNPYFLQSRLKKYPDYNTKYDAVFKEMTGEPNPLFILLPINKFISILMNTPT